MTVFQECLLGGLAATSPIWGSCLIFAVCWAVKYIRRERQIWKEAGLDD